MIATQQCFYTTVSKEAIPNIGPKRSNLILKVYTLLFEKCIDGTNQNILVGPNIYVAVVDRENVEGYRFLDAAELSIKKNQPIPKDNKRIKEIITNIKKVT